MTKYIFNNRKYYNNIEMECPEIGFNDYYDAKYSLFRKSTLLNEAIKRNNNEIIRMILKHTKMDEKTINMFFRNNRHECITSSMSDVFSKDTKIATIIKKYH